jgi:hypothetical protein
VSTSQGVKYLDQVIFGLASSPHFRPNYHLFGGFGEMATCAEVKYAFHFAKDV